MKVRYCQISFTIMKVSKLLFLQMKAWGFAYSQASSKGLSERPEIIELIALLPKLWKALNSVYWIMLLPFILSKLPCSMSELWGFTGRLLRDAAQKYTDGW